MNIQNHTSRTESYVDLSDQELLEKLNEDPHTYSEEEYDMIIDILLERNVIDDYDDIPSYRGGRNERADWLMFDEGPDDITGMDPKELQKILDSDDPYITFPEM
ncbi:MAG: hypothetical protein H6766_07685 [Candidatus Peribacteria bacterium]|nr:MAG: hypothetical protein H6766_07685 [Candidatus Peribacteria bacterium]